MSASATGLGSNKKGGRVSDASAVTAQRRIIAQGQADSTYSSIQKKNGFRTSKSVLNSEQYNSSVLVAQNLGIAGPTVICPSITVEDIAIPTDIYGQTIWVLNADTTILACQTLTITAIYPFLIDSKNLTNNGTIIIESGAQFASGSFSLVGPTTFTNNGTCINNGFFTNFATGITNNNGTIENQAGGIFSNDVLCTINNNGTIYNNGPCSNEGTINNAGIIYVYDGGILDGAGTIANSGTIENHAGGTIENQQGGIFSNDILGIINNNGNFSNIDALFTNNGNFNNAGIIYVYEADSNIVDNGIITNSGTIYVYNGGEIDGSGTIANSGTISVADGTSTCGTGTISATVTGNPTTIGCPP